MMRRYRVLLYALLKMETPFHSGSGRLDDPFTDQPVLRDICGTPFISGGALAGSFSATLDNQTRFEWMGTNRSEDEAPKASRLIMDDAYPLPAQQNSLRFPVEIRSMNTLLRESLTAKKGSYFNLEVLPTGTEFCFGCRCDLDNEGEKMRFVETVKRYLAHGGQLGGKDNSGLGRWVCRNVGYRCLDMEKTEDLLCWLESLHGFSWEGNLSGLKSLHGFKLVDLPGEKSNQTWRMILNAKIENGLHLSSGSSGLPEKGVPDLRQVRRQKITENGELTSEPVDYGTTVKGRLRTAMEILLRSYLIESDCDQDMVKEVVPCDPSHSKGSRSEEINDFFGRAGTGEKRAKKGHWRVGESAWDGAGKERQDHIQLDEFTQQVMTGAKFDFEPLNCGNSTVEISLDNPKPWHKILVYYAGKFLAHNILPWGGHGARGYLGADISVGRYDQVPDNPKAILKALMATLIDNNNDRE